MNMEIIWQQFTAVMLASLGALVRMLGAKDKRVAKFKRIITEMIGAGFLGYLVMLGGDYLSWDARIISILCGTVGILGIDAVTLLNWLLKKIGIDFGLDDKEEKK